MATMWFVLVAVLPAVVVGYSPKTEYIEDYCGRGSYRLSKDMILRFSDTRSIIPKAPYTCSMAVQSKDTSRQLQVRVLMLDMARKSTCSSGALVIQEGDRFLTPSYGVCGTSAPSKNYRTAASKVTIELNNRAQVSTYGDFKLLITSIYNATNSSCYGDDFQCNNGLCVSSQLVCNGYDDCGDDSDERDGCALAAGVIVGIVFAVVFVVLVFAAVGAFYGRRRRRYMRVTRVVREYPTVNQPVIAGGYVPSYSTTTSSYQKI